MKDTALQRLRAIALQRPREALATSWIVAPPDQAEIRRTNEYKDHIECATKKELYGIISQIEAKIKEIRAAYRISAPASKLLALLERMEAAPPGKATLLPLHMWGQLFKGNQHPFGGMDAWPVHARIALDASGRMYSRSRHPEVYLLEATMFEDMASLFNLAKHEYERTKGSTADKPIIKRRNALCRSTITAAIHFVESYVNGIAVDYVVTHEPGLEPATKSLLLDWDFGRNRPRYLSLRDKILQYQRIILGVPHAPLQETNSPEMKTIVETAKLIRDAIAHPSPALDPKTMAPEKECAVLGLDFLQTEVVVDAAVALVRRLEETLHGSLKRLFWLYECSVEGVFPDAAFQ
jgi:hypothetical protein